MFTLTCHRTFIHAEADEEEKPIARRSQSVPADDRITQQSYASALASRADQLHYWLRKRDSQQNEDAKEGKDTRAARDAEASTEAETRDSTESMRMSSNNSDTSEPENEISQGSLGHPEVCHRPCVNFAKGFCATGASCDYCHLSHVANPMVTANKEVRAILQVATEVDLLAPAMRHAWARAADKGFLAAADEVLDLLKARLGQLPQPSLGEKQQGKLDRFMAKMPFSGLMGLALRKAEDADHVREVKAAVDSLRSNLTMTD